MAELNPDIRGADEVELPDDFSNLQGWKVPDVTEESDMIAAEQKKLDELEQELPPVFRTKSQGPMAEEVYKKWVEFQKSKGRYEGSCDWSLLDEFVLKKELLWLPQIIGSCVCSNTFRPWVIRNMIQNVFYSGEYVGTNEFGPDNFSFWCPYSYGMSRKRGNLRGGDGSFCGVMAESLMKDGVVKCTSPTVMDLHAKYGVTGERDYPEPQGSKGARLYRYVGDWPRDLMNKLSEETDNKLNESPRITNVDQLMDLLRQGKPSFVCSGEAIHKIGTHPDGFAIHARDPRNSWAHNMSFHGIHVASDGEEFIVESNESWGKRHIYRRRPAEVQKSFSARRLTVQAIGELSGPLSGPPVIEVN